MAEDQRLDAILERDEPEEDVVLFKLTQRNLERLIHATQVGLQGRRKTAQILLERLRRICPEAGRGFRLKEGVLDRFPFRLLFGRDAVILQDPSHQVQKYVVISYCWQDSAQWTPGVESQCKPWPFSAAMAQAVFASLDSTDDGIFLDQLCINQTHDDEKAIAIASMDTIYRNAYAMLVMLEDVILSEAEEADWFEHVAECFSCGFSYVEVTDIIAKVLSARWFSRAWCSHEFIVRCKPSTGRLQGVIYCIYGSTGSVIRITDRLLEPKILGFVGEILPSGDRLFGTSHPSLVTEQERLLSWFLRLNRDETGSRKRRSLIGHYVDIEQLSCSVPSDRVSICLNMNEIDLWYSSSFAPRDYYFWVIGALSIAAGETSILLSTGSQLQFEFCGQEINSWIHRFKGVSSETRLYELLPSLQSAATTTSSITTVHPSYIELDIFLIKPQCPSPDAMSKAKAIVKKFQAAHSFTDVHEYQLYASSQDLKTSFPSTWIDSFTETLACCIDPGHHWILTTTESRLLEYFGPHAGQIDKALCPIAEDLAAIIDQSHSCTIDTSIGVNLTVSTEAVDAQEVLRILTHLKSYPVGKHLPSGLRAVPISSDSMIAQVPSQYALAIPTDLAGSPWYRTSSFGRVWVLDRMTKLPEHKGLEVGSAAWRLVDRVPLLSK